MHLAVHRADQFRVRQRTGAHHVAQVQFFADGDRGQRHALGPVLAAVSRRKRVPDGQDQTLGGPFLRGRPDEGPVRGERHGLLPERADAVPASALQQNVELSEQRHRRFSNTAGRY